MTELSNLDDLTTLSQPQGLLLTGEGLSSMTPERLQMLGEIVGGLGLKVTAVRDLGPLGEYIEETLRPVPATREDFQVFAAENGYTSYMGHRSFNAVIFTDTPPYRRENPNDPFPPVRFIGGRVADDIPLQSVYQRLVASDMNPKAWVRCGKGMVRFLAHIVNERVQPDELLPIDTSQGSNKT